METVLKVENLTHTYEGTDRPAIEDINFSVKRGEVIGLVGESGSGKSTILNALSKIISPTGGSIEVLGHPLENYGTDLYQNMQLIFQNARASLNPRHKVGYILQEIQDHLVDEPVDLEDLVQQVGLDASYLDKYPRQLSGGECQRVAIARAFSVNPSLLLCDEVTSALDPITARRIVALIYDLAVRQNKSVIFVSHNIPLVSSFCDQVVILNEGRVVEAGKTQEVFRNPQSAFTRRLLEHTLSV